MIYVIEHVRTHSHSMQTPLPTVSYLSEASWMETTNMPPDEIAKFADPASEVKRQESFLKFNASMAATKFTPAKRS